MAAAVLAGVSIGAYPDFPTALEKTIVLDRAFEPDARASDAYNQLFPMYKTLYKEVAHHFEELAKMDLPQVWVTKKD